jgi:ABC-type sulfate transport system permease component
MPFDRYWLALGAETAGLATAIAAMAGAPLAWLLENREFRGSRAVSAVVHVATALPAPLLCYFLLAPISLPGMTGAGVLSVLPLLIRQMRSAFSALSPSFGKAARSLGASEGLVFLRVELPMVWRPVAMAAAWALARLLLELAAAYWIGGRRP